MPASIGGRLMLVALYAGAAAAYAAETRSCTVQAVRGDAVLIEPANEKPLAAGMALAAGSRLGTGKAASIDVLCSDQTRVTVGAETEIDLGSLVGALGAQASVVVYLHSGIARFLAPARTWSSFGVRGPAAVASVRQTEWIVEAPPGATHVFVVKGRVAVDAGVGGALQLAEGEGIDVAATALRARSGGRDAPNGKLGERRKWSAERVEQAMQRLGAR